MPHGWKGRGDSLAWRILVPSKACRWQMTSWWASAGDAGVAGRAVRAQDALQCLRRALHEAGEEEIGCRLPLRSPHERWRSLHSKRRSWGSCLLQRHIQHCRLAAHSKARIKRGLLHQAAKKTHLGICLCVAPWLQGLAAAYTASPLARLFACPSFLIPTFDDSKSLLACTVRDCDLVSPCLGQIITR